MENIEETYTIQVPIKITYETLYNIMWSALCQGGYWINIITDDKGKGVDIGYMLKEGNTTYFLSYFSDEKTPFTLNSFIKGITQYVAEYGDCISNGEIDSCKIDSPSCDIILQYSLFGKQEYA